LPRIADLHTHSTCSDGSLTPEELVQEAARIGLSGLAITDHDTVEAYARALPVAEEVGLSLIPGAEFSAVICDEPVHLLAYSFRVDNPEILALCERHRQRRVRRNREILEKLKSHGMVVEEREVAALSSSVVGRPHIASVMVEKGYASSVTAAFSRWIGSGCPCHAVGEKISAEETIEAVRAAGGLVVIAHPGVIRKGDAIASLLRLGVDGIEGYYSHLSYNQEKPWIDLARAHNLLITGGSDFHGTCKPRVRLGSSWAPEESFDRLWSHYHGL